jgi:hypothetical protein
LSAGVFDSQDDLLYESLTVWEVLYYAAMLRLPRTMTTEQKKERVRTVIRALGIERCKDTIIGTRPSSMNVIIMTCLDGLGMRILQYSCCFLCWSVLTLGQCEND